MMKYRKNVFLLTLDLLSIKHTKSYANMLFEESPYKNSLYGLSQLFSEYNVDNCGVILKKDPDVLKDLMTPFIAYVNNDFVVVSSLNENQIEYYLNENRYVKTYQEFFSIWDGVSLLMRPDEYSKEPNYEINKKELFRTNIFFASLVFFPILFLFVSLLNTWSDIAIPHILSLLINLLGLYVSYLLLLKKMNIENKNADKICSIFKSYGADCEIVIKENKSVVFWNIAWSEIGFTYFFINSLLIVLYPLSYSSLALINVFALPFTFWSVWYQGKVLKHWCPLCLIVQFVLWIIFFNNLFFKLIQINHGVVFDSIILCCSYLFFLLLLNQSLRFWDNYISSKKIIGKYNSIKIDTDVFKILMNNQKRYNIDTSIGINLGDYNSKNVITIVSNPHCKPCALLHKYLRKLMIKSYHKFLFQILFTSFNKNLEDSVFSLICAYKNNNEFAFIDILDEWYEDGKNHRSKFYSKYQFDKNDELLICEVNNQKDWIITNHIYQTPLVLFNGYILSDKYEIEDLMYFADIDLL